MINPLYSVLAFTVTSIYLIKSIREKEETSKLWCLATGQLLGLILIVPNMNTIYPDFSHNLLEEFIPKMVETNFFMTLITSALILFCSVKVFMSKNSFLTILSIIGISSYLFSSLLTDSIYLNYVTFICHFLSEYFILKNLGTSRIFKRNIDIFFTFKALFIILLTIFGGITYESTVLLYVIDILIILEIYDHVFPTEFLGNIWYLAMVMSIISNIYIYNIVSTKYDEMNMYIKNRLECTTEDINLPSKYKTEYLYDYLPNDKDKLKIYTEYYEIDIYSDTKRNIRFRE